MIAIPVQVLHNVARECRRCGNPVIEDGRDSCHLDHPPKWHGRYAVQGALVDAKQCMLPADTLAQPHEAGLANFDGYQPGQPLVRVYRTTYAPDVGMDPDLRQDPAVFASAMFTACNVGPGMVTGELERIRGEYRARRLRSVSVGDVIAIGETPLACASVGWQAITGAVNILAEWPESTHTVIWKEQAA
jgi:hypothetical protein